MTNNMIVVVVAICVCLATATTTTTTTTTSLVDAQDLEDFCVNLMEYLLSKPQKGKEMIMVCKVGR